MRFSFASGADGAAPAGAVRVCVWPAARFDALIRYRYGWPGKLTAPAARWADGGVAPRRATHGIPGQAARPILPDGSAMSFARAPDLYR